MFASAPSGLPSPPDNNTTPTSPTRPSRLRGLSAIRNYTQHHLSLHHSQPSSPTSPSPGASGLSRFLTGPASASLGAGGTQEAELRDSYFGAPNTLERPPTGDGAQDSMPRRRPVPHVPTNRPPGAPTMVSNAPPRGPPAGVETAAADSLGLAGLPAEQMPTIRFIPYQDPRSSKPSLAFPATSRTLPHEDCVIRVGRYSERDLSTNVAPGIPSAAPVGFKSKVVSRRHCEFWCSRGQWYVKDVKSSSGTFLNHIRLSQPSHESRPFPVNDGDVIQLGIDFRGGEEQIFRCVKIRVECNRAWQQGLNNFNKSTHKRLKALSAARGDGDNVSNYTSECSICLMSIAPCQSLFVAPCSHVWHFRCIRPILNDPKNYPQFLCPNCRAVADLEADVDEMPANWADEEGNSSGSEAAPKSSSRPRGNTVATSGNGSEQDSDLDRAIAASLRESLRIGDGGVGGSAANQSGMAAAAEQRTTSSTTHALNPTESPLPISPQSAQPNSGPLLAELDTPTTPGNAMTVAVSGQIGSAGASASLAAGVGATMQLPGTEPHDPYMQSEGPLTPRNEAGPFIFDGSSGGGEISESRVHHAQQASA